MELIDGHYIGSGEKNVYTKIVGIGDPAVIIEPGFGSLSVEWNDIQAALSNFTTVVTYDRAGFGESPVGKSPRSSGQVCDELYNMLMNSGIPGPYILVGHSIGGLFAQHFTKLFPESVAGLVLVDSMTVKEKELEELDLPEYKEKMSMKVRMENMKKYIEMGKEEFKQMVEPMLKGLYSSFPEHLQEAMVLYQADQNFYKTLLNEYMSLEESFEAISNLHIFTNIPVKVLVRDFNVMIALAKQMGFNEEEAKIIEEKWLANSKELLNLSTESELKIIKDSNQAIHLSRPDAIIEEVKDIIETIRNDN